MTRPRDSPTGKKSDTIGSPLANCLMLKRGFVAYDPSKITHPSKKIEGHSSGITLGSHYLQSA